MTERLKLAEGLRLLDATQKKLKAEPIDLERLRNKLPTTITKYPWAWARKMGPQ